MVDQAAAREIFEHELAALTDAEEKTAEVLGKIVPQIHSLKLQQLLANYQQVTAGQVKRLADIFNLLKVTPQKAAYQSACYKYLNGLANASNNNNCAILVYDSQTEERDMIQNVDRLVVDLYHDLASG